MSKRDPTPGTLCAQVLPASVALRRATGKKPTVRNRAAWQSLPRPVMFSGGRPDRVATGCQLVTPRDAGQPSSWWTRVITVPLVPCPCIDASAWRYLSQPKSLGTNLGPHVPRAPERPACSCPIRDPRGTRIPGVGRINVPAPFPGGQVVAGSNPVSPTRSEGVLVLPNRSAVQQVSRPACAELGGRSVPLCQQRCESIGVDRQAHPI